MSKNSKRCTRDPKPILWRNITQLKSANLSFIFFKVVDRLMSYLLQQNRQEVEHPVRVPGLPADFEQPGWARPHHHPEALGQTKVPGHKSVSWLQLLSDHLTWNYWKVATMGVGLKNTRRNVASNSKTPMYIVQVLCHMGSNGGVQEEPRVDANWLPCCL